MTGRPAPPKAPPPPRAAVVLLVLLLAVLPPAPGCVFPHSPVTSTFTAAISELREHLLLDYSVLMPANLEPDARCTELWMVHFLAAELGRMGGVAGRGPAAPAGRGGQRDPLHQELRHL
ncbi:fms-related tyrosine kinase 3 ligand isoform X1 [Pelodiscus sinensis]|uniref:fms-related tyrosine kinase 3 ligand isoform X1 n=1 Tax=Pelodiscus sinensis TaxID=13735 RepID=UPI003F6A7119